MEQPGEYDIVHPIWLRGREYGIAEEREQILELLRSQLEASAKVIYAQNGFARGVRVALEQIIQEINDR